MWLKMHVTEAFLAQKHTDGRRCMHLRRAHADVPCKGSKIDYSPLRPRRRLRLG